MQSPPPLLRTAKDLLLHMADEAIKYITLLGIKVKH